MIYYCADDYGMSDETCRRIENCIKNGVLNKISVLPNGMINDLKNRIDDNVSVALHVNLVEGRALSDLGDVSLLVSDDGYFRYSFAELFFLSLSKQRKALEKQIYTEIKNQIRYMKNLARDSSSFMIDSHQHTHMIPLVFKTLMRVIREENINVQYLRIPSEPVMPYIKSPSLYLTYKPLNIVKQWLLKFLALINHNEIKKSGIRTAYFMGVLFSGNMDEKRVRKLTGAYVKLAGKTKKDIELAFHPGFFEHGDEPVDNIKEGFKKFYLSPGRKIEYETLLKLNSQK